MPTVDELSCSGFWESQESCVLVNSRSEESKRVGAIVKSWIEKREDLKGSIWVATKNIWFGYYLLPVDTYYIVA